MSRMHTPVKLELQGESTPRDFLLHIISYHISINSPWEALPPMSIARRRLACGLATRKDSESKMIVVAGGEKLDEPHYLGSSEIYYWEKRQWEHGNSS